MENIALLDTALHSANSGDQIIMDAIESELAISPDVLRIATHIALTEEAKDIVRASKAVLLCGTNALGRDMSNSPWVLSAEDMASGLFDGKLVLVGCGWGYYNTRPATEETADFFRRSLHKDAFHSVRDQFTANKLTELGCKNVLNTGCPTMWSLYKWQKPLRTDNVIFTLTDYRQDKTKDNQLLQVLICEFANVYFWPQGAGDLEYLKSLPSYTEELISTVDHSLSAFNAMLTPDMTYVGTRLHAAIRAMQLGLPSKLVSIDNRATEISKDTGLPIVDRNDIDFKDNLTSFINDQTERLMTSNTTNIMRFMFNAV